MKYYSLLKTTAPSDVLSIPLKAVVTRYSSTAAAIMSKPRVYRNGEFSSKYQTIGDLLELGYEGTYNVLAQTNLSSDEREDALYSIEEALASIGLKFKDSEFSVGDVRVKSLMLSESIMSALRGSRRSVETIDDLIIFGREKFLALKGIDSQYDFNKVGRALERFGVKMEGGGYTLDRSKQFPLTAYSEYLKESKEKIEKAEKKQPAETSLEELKKLEKSEILSRNVSALGILRKIVSRLEDCGVETIGDMVKKGYKIYLNLEPALYLNLKKKLASLDLKFDGADYDIADGKITRSTTLPVFMSEYGTRPFDFQTATDEQKAAFLNTPVKKFGFSKTMYSHMENKYSTIGEMINALRNNSTNFSSCVISHLKSCFRKFNIDVEPQKVKLQQRKYFSVKEVGRLVKFDDLDEKGKEARLNQKLTESVMYPEFAEAICTALNVSTIGELHELSRSTIRNAMGVQSYAKICEFLSVQGLKLKPEKIKHYDIEHRSIVDVRALSEEERREFMKNDVSRLGFKQVVVESLATNLGVFTIEELTKQSSKSLYRGLGSSLSSQVLSAARKYNIELCKQTPEDIALKKKERTLERIKAASQRNRCAAHLYLPNVEGLDPTSETTREYVKSIKIEDIGLSKPVIDTLKANQILSVGEMISLSRSVLNSLTNNPRLSRRIAILLQPYDLKFRSPSFKSQKPSKEERAPKPQKTVTLMRTPLNELGIAKRDAKVIESKGIHTFGDIIKYSYLDIVQMFDQDITDKLCEVVSKHGRVFLPREDVISTREVEEEHGQLGLNLHISSLSCDIKEKEYALLSGIVHIQDFMSVPLKTRKKVISECGSFTSAVRPILQDNGYDVDEKGEIVEFVRPKRREVLVSGVALTDKQKRELLLFERSGLHKHTVDLLKAANLQSLSDLEGMQVADVCQMLNRNAKELRQIKTMLELCGMKLERRKYGEASVREGFESACKIFETLGAEEAKKQPVEALGISQIYIERLKENGINTIGEISSLTKIELNKILVSHDCGQNIIKVFEKYGVKFEKSNIVQEKGQPKEKMPAWLVGRKFDQLSEEEKQRLLSLPITVFGFKQNTQGKFSRLNINTIGDISKYTYTELVNGGISTGTARNVRKLLNDLGIIDYSDHLRGLGKKNLYGLAKEYKTFDAMTEEEKEEFLSQDIAVIGITKTNLERLHAGGVLTISQLAKCSRRDLEQMNISGNACSVVHQFFRKYKLYRKNERIRELNASSLAKYSQSDGLELDIEELDIGKAQVEILHGLGVYKVKDLEKVSHGQLWGLGGTKRFVEYISEVKNMFDIYQEKTPKQRTDEYLKAMDGKTFDMLTEEEKEKLLSTSLYDVGMGKVWAEKLRAVGIATIGDAAKSNYSLVKRVATGNGAAKVRLILSAVGLDYVDARKNRIMQRKDVIDFATFGTLSDDEKQKMLNMPFENFGIRLGKENLHANGIFSMRDIAATDGSELYKCLGAYGYRVVTTRCNEYGIELKPRHVGRAKAEYIESIPRKPIAEMSEKEKARLYNFDIKHLFSPHTTKKLKSDGIETIGDILKVDYKEFMKRSRNNQSVRNVIRQICDRFEIDYIPADIKPPRTITSKIVLTAEEQYFFDQGFSAAVAKKLCLAGYKTIEDVEKESSKQLKLALGTSAYDSAKRTLERRELVRAEEKSTIQTSQEGTLLDRLKADGVEVLKSLQRQDFIDDEKRLLVEEALQDYYKWAYETKVFTSPNEQLLLMRNSWLESEKSRAQSIIASMSSAEAAAKEGTALETNESEAQDNILEEQDDEQDEDDK